MDVRRGMSSRLNDVLLGTKIEQWILKGASPDEMEEMMVVEFLSNRMGKSGIVIVSDGETTFKCLPDSISAQPKTKK